VYGIASEVSRLRDFRERTIAPGRRSRTVFRVRLSLVELVLLAAAAAIAATALPGCLAAPGGPAVRASWLLTPGVLNPGVTQATIASTICRRGWTRTIRPPVSYTNGLKAKGLLAYRLRGPPSAYQEDHLISLELGGDPVDPRNLWPEPYPRAAAVDTIENELNRKVCSGELSLPDAQRLESALKHADG
jgi:hypothetical protein